MVSENVGRGRSPTTWWWKTSPSRQAGEEVFGISKIRQGSKIWLERVKKKTHRKSKQIVPTTENWKELGNNMWHRRKGPQFRSGLSGGKEGLEMASKSVAAAATEQQQRRRANGVAVPVRPTRELTAADGCQLSCAGDFEESSAPVSMHASCALG